MRSSNYSPAGERGLFRRDRRIYDQRGTFTFTIPDGVTKVWAFVIGAGGGGARYGQADTQHDWGMVKAGCGGGYASGIISGLTPGGTLTATIGNGGNGAFENTAAVTGGNTTLAGGGTTYLQGNGGAGGSNTPVTSDPGNQKGQGGSATTSSVTDAYTAAGGGNCTWPKGVGYTETTATTLSYVCGGGSSGTPWGTGNTCTMPVATKIIATGGGGWCQDPGYRHAYILPWTSSGAAEYRMGEGSILSGMGSHHTTKQLLRGDFAGRGQGHKGGNGRTAKGGTALDMSWLNATTGSSWQNYYIGNDVYPGLYPQQEADLQGQMDGEDGNPNWWFPWEIDGGGGGSLNGSSGSTHLMAGSGGPGAGGGGMGGYNSNTCMAHGGNGGFGGGGGSSRMGLTNIDYMGYSQGGHGGNGGGGGSAYGRIEARSGTTLYMPIGGNGGDGAIGIYW